MASASDKRVAMLRERQENSHMIAILQQQLALSPEQWNKLYRYNRSEPIAKRQKLRLQIAIDYLKKSMPLSFEPSPQTQQWRILALIRERAFTWNPLCSIWFTLTDVDDEPLLPLKDEREWAKLCAMRNLLTQDKGVMLDRARHLVPPGDNKFHMAWVLWSLSLDVLADHRKAFGQLMSLEKGKAERAPDDTKHIEARLNDVLAEFARRGLGNGFTNKRAWLIQRLLLPLGGLDIAEWVEHMLDTHTLGMDFRWDTQTKQFLAVAASHACQMAGFATGGFQVEDKKKTEADPDVFKDEKKAAEIVNEGAAAAAAVVKQKDPRIGVDDITAVLFDWMPQPSHGFERLDAMPASVKAAPEFTKMKEFLYQIQILCAFGDYIDSHYLGKDDANKQFLRRYVVLDMDLDRRDKIWASQGEGKGAWYHKAPAFIYVSSKGFSVGCQTRLSETFATVKPALCVWYLFMIRLCGGVLANQARLEDWTQPPAVAVPMQE
jgi:hypothetical protein